MARICLCLTAKTIELNLETLNKYRKYADIAELRVDCLAPDERLSIRRFPELAGMPVVLSIRRDVDGGFFSGGEGARVKLLARGLAFAEADKRRNFAYVDIEEDLNVPSLEEATRTFGTRIIRSSYNLRGFPENISDKIQNMLHSGDELAKIVVTANSTADVLRLFRVGKECAVQEKILYCTGRYGMCSRILAEQFGSFLTYAMPLAETGVSPETGEIDVRELAELYRFRHITRNTKLYGVVGYPLQAAGSLWFFNTVFALEEIGAVYVPFPADSIGAFMELAWELGLSGLSVTVPYKEAVIPFLGRKADEVEAIGACNTLSRREQGWFGTNTDAKGFSASLLDFIGKSSLKRQRVTIIGAGGIARAAASEVHRLGGKALILNRTVHKARDLSFPYKFAWGGLDSQGVEMIRKYRDIIIQATSAGMEGSGVSDPLEMYTFSGREAVMDLVYQPEQSPFLRRAAASGCRTRNGYDMLTRQAQDQYAQFLGKEFPVQLMSRVKYGRN